MAPLWLPQNVQKRVFRYILTRLAVFSNLDLDNLDVSLGTTQTQLSLNNVQLDTDKLSFLPGIYVRGGQIANLDLKLAVMGGVRVEGSGILLTVSLPKKVLVDASHTDELIASFLKRTTADLAESIMISADTHQVDQDLAASFAASMDISQLQQQQQQRQQQQAPILGSSVTSSVSSDDSVKSVETKLGLGYGMGDFSGMVNRVVDAAISQLNIVLNDIKILVVLGDVTLELSVNSVKLNTTEDGIRHFSISDITCTLVSSPDDDEPEQQINDEHENEIDLDSAPESSLFQSTFPDPFSSSDSGMQQSMYHDADGGSGYQSLMQSMMFSREEASSIYMSAMAMSEANPNSFPPRPRPLIFWCESLKLSFKGLKMSALSVDAGRLHLSLKHLPVIALPLVEFIKSHSNHSSESAEPVSGSSTPPQTSLEQDDAFSLEKACIQCVEINLTSALLPNGLYEDDTSIRLVLDKLDYLNGLSTQTFSISTIALEGRTGPIIAFPSPSGVSKPNDFTCQISDDKKSSEKGSKVCKLMIPTSGKINLTTDDVFELQDVVQSFQSVFESFATLSQSQPEEVPVSESPKLNILGQTSAFELKLKLESSLIAMTIFPISFDPNFLISCPQVMLRFPDRANDVILKKLSFNYLTTSGISKKLSIMSGNINCNIKQLQDLGNEFKQLQVSWVPKIKIRSKLDQALSSTDDIQYQRMQHETRARQPLRPTLDEPLFEVNIAYLGLQVVLAGKLGKIDVDLGDLRTVLRKSGRSVIELSTIHVSRDMSDIDPSLGHLSVIHKVNDLKLTKPLLQVKLDSSGIPTLVSLNNLEIEYDVHLLELFDNSKEPNSQQPSSSPSAVASSVPVLPQTTILSESVSTVCDSEFTIPIQLVDCVIGLAPLHLPSHACLLISTGKASVKVAQISGEISANLDIARASLLMVDDKKYLSSMGAVPASEKRRRSDLALQYLGQGYVSVAIITGLSTEINVIPERPSLQKMSISIDLDIDGVYMKSTADSTHSLIQLVNDLKPPVEATPPELKYRTSIPSPINTMSSIDTQVFHPDNLQKLTTAIGDDFNADFVTDDVPTNLEFIESYYGDHGGARSSSQWTSSSGSLNTSYSNTDLLLEEDLSVMVARNKAAAAASNNLDSQGVVDFNDASMRKLGTFEQRVKSHDPIINITENHFGNASKARKSHSVGGHLHPSMPLASDAKVHRHKNAKHTSSLPHLAEQPQHQHPDDSSEGSEFYNSIHESSSFSHIGGPEDTTTTGPNSFGTYKSTDSGASKPPISIDFKVADFTWDMHDGYDWHYTRDMITKAVFRVEYEAQEIRKIQAEEEARRKRDSQDLNSGKQSQTRPSTNKGATIYSDDEDEDLDSGAGSPVSDGDDVVADVLFNSIYITMSTHQDSSDLRKMINKDINDEASDTMSVTSNRTSHSNPPSTRSGSTSPRVTSSFKPSPSLARELRHAGGGKSSKLKLKRSKYHKVRIHLSGIHGNMSIFLGVNDVLPPDSMLNRYLLNRIDVNVTDAEIFDNVATSTWNKFLTYMRSEGEREEGASMFHLIMENVRPVPEIATSEIVLNVFVLPLRLHVDQDTLDFITRFFEFQDDRFDSLVAGLQDEIPFIQKADIRAVKVKLDYKPKKIDYAGLRSGHTTEFMNFFILDEAEMVLKRVKLYGISGFPRLSQMLNGIWMPDIRSNQLGDVLAGLAPVRSIVRLGSGLKDLVVVPVREYRKDGRVIRSIQKGAWQFARNTTSELVKFGAKLAAGTQTILENAEQAMGGSGSAGRQLGVVSDEEDDDESMGTERARRSGLAREYNDDDYIEGDNDGNYDDDEDFDTASNSTLQPRGVRFSKDAMGDYDNESVRSRQSYRTTTSTSTFGKPSTRHAHTKASNSSGSSPKSSSPGAVSLYANQPVGVVQGIYSAYGSMGRNLAIAKHAVTDIKAEAAETGSAQGAAMAIMRATPIALIRPMIGATEAVSKTLLGVTNQMDPDQIQYMEEKYRGQQSSLGSSPGGISGSPGSNAGSMSPRRNK